MDKYKKLKKQISTDAGVTWTDVIPYEYMKGALIERDSADCSDITWQLVYGEYICEEIEDPAEPIYEWRTVQGEYVCNGYDKCQKEAEYVSTDLGASWTATGNERIGSTVETDSDYCGYRPTPTDDCYITEGGGMSVGYTSISEGQTIAYKYDFTNTGCFYREASDRQSTNDPNDINYPLAYDKFFPDCENGVAFGMSVSYFADGSGSFPADYKIIFADCNGITQTITLDANIGTSSCDDAALEKSNFAVTARTLWNCITKLETSGRYTFAGIIQKDEYSKALLRFDFDTVNKTVSNVTLTVSCIHKRYRRVPVADSYICEGTDKYQAVHVYESDDDGETWNDMGIQAGLLIEANSEDCGYIPPVITRWVTVPNDYQCVGYDKYNKEKEQESTDGGQTWTDTGNTRAGSTLIEANSEDCGYVPPTPPISSEYLTFESLENNNYIKWDCSTLTIPEAPRTIYYSTDKVTWTSVTSSTSATLITVLNTGDKVYVKANGTNYASPSYYNNFTTSKRVNLSGNIMSLLYSDNFVGKTTLTSTYTFAYLFNTCKIVSIENLVLPATTLATGCYSSMFSNCTNLTTVPSGLLPATTLADDCYSNMFYGCTSLTSIPSNLLPATTLTYNCYKGMFYYCTSLTTPPDLLAATLAERCYYYMFEGCSSLNYIKCLATDITATECTNGWVYGVAASGTFVKNPSMSSWTTGTSGIPSGWTVVDAT